MKLYKEIKTEKQYNKLKKIDGIPLTKFLVTRLVYIYIFCFAFFNLAGLVLDGRLYLFRLLPQVSLWYLFMLLLFIPLLLFVKKGAAVTTKDYEAKKRFEENTEEYKNGWGGKIKGTNDNDHFSYTNEKSYEGKGVHATTETDVFVGEYDLSDESKLSNKQKKKRKSPLNEIKFHNYFDENGNYLGDESPRELLDDMLDDIKKGFITKSEQIEELNNKGLPKSMYDFFIEGINKNA
ncbi:hypothetical protein [Labilibaculum euxinus]